MSCHAAFVFVNKTAQSASLTRSHGKERLDIFSHVQNSHLQQTDHGFILVTPANFTSSKPSNQKQLACLQDGKGMRRVKELGELDIDPFQTFQVRMTETMQSLLAYYFTSVLPTVWPGATLKPAKQDMMSYAMRDPAVLYALLGLSNSIRSVGKRHAHHVRDAREFRHQTMVHVQKRLNTASRVSPTTAYAVALLLRLECGEQDFQTAGIHAEGLVSIMDSLDSPQEIPTSLLLGIQTTLEFCSIMLGRPSPSTAPASPKGTSVDDTISNTPPTDSDINNMTPAQSAPCPFVTEPYLKIVGDWISYFAIKRHLLHTHIPYPGHDGAKICPGRLHLLHVDSCSLEEGLLSLSPPGPTDTPSYLTFNVVRFALYFTCGPAVDVAQPKTSTQRSCAVKLRTALEDAISLLLWYPCLDLLLWALTVAACVSYQQDEWEWVISQATSICRELAIPSLSEFEKTIAPFGGVAENSARIVWAAIHDVGDEER